MEFTPQDLWSTFDHFWPLSWKTQIIITTETLDFKIFSLFSLAKFFFHQYRPNIKWFCDDRSKLLTNIKTKTKMSDISYIHHTALVQTQSIKIRSFVMKEK